MAIFSGQVTVATAGTAVPLAAGQVVNAPLMVKALPTNAGTLYVGQVAGDVDSSNGLPLLPGEGLVLNFVGNLNQVWLDSSADGGQAAWLVLSL